MTYNDRHIDIASAVPTPFLCLKLRRHSGGCRSSIPGISLPALSEAAHASSHFSHLPGGSRFVKIGEFLGRTNRKPSYFGHSRALDLYNLVSKAPQVGNE